MLIPDVTRVQNIYGCIEGMYNVTKIMLYNASFYHCINKNFTVACIR